MAVGWLGVHKREGDRPDFILHPWAFACSKPHCFMSVSADTKTDAERIRDTHRCPEPGGTTHISGEITMTLVQKMWNRVDLLMDELMANMELQESEPTDGRAEDIIRQQGRLREMCWCLALFMNPHFTSEDEVAQEVRIRARHRRKGETDYVTKGLGSRVYELPRSEDKPPIGSAERPRVTVPPRPTVPAKPTKSKLTDDEIKAIKFAISSGMFSNAELARTYKVSEAVIAQVASS